MDTLGFIVLMTLLAALLYSPLYIGTLLNRKRNEEIKQRVYSGRFMTAEEFEKDRLIKGFTGNYGSRYSDTSGCYIILIFDRPVTDGDFERYRNGYIGQSINVISRVHNHLNGKGNGDVYADIKYGKYVYVKIITCPISELNSLEVKLIRAFDRNRLYNRSKGGGAKHEGIPDRQYSGSYSNHCEERKKDK